MQGFCFFVEKNKKIFEDFFHILADRYNIDLNIIAIKINAYNEAQEKLTELTQYVENSCRY